MTEASGTLSLSKLPLSSTIDYAQDIAPYPLTMIYAGIGAGKNTFAGQLMNGSVENNIPKKTVLLITSRKAKVTETLDDRRLDVYQSIGDESSRWNIFHQPPYDERPYTRLLPTGQKIIQCSVACTNAFLKAWLQHVYDPMDPTTHLWNRFDVIIVDEAHALTMDATYQDAPYHVASLIRETHSRIVAARKNELLPLEERDPSILRPTCQNIILMTGTPEALDEVAFPYDMHILDRRKVCRNVMPKNIHLIDRIQAKRKIQEHLHSGERILYFTNHIIPAETLSETYGIPIEQVTSSFSDEERLRDLKTASDVWKSLPENEGKESVYDRMIDVQKHLAQNSLIRSDIRLFATTSKNKEGININDTDIQHVFIESHSLTDIRQMAGRLRHGTEHAYIITDAAGHNMHENAFEQALSEQMCCLPFQPLDGREPVIELNPLNQILYIACYQHDGILKAGKPVQQLRIYDPAWPSIGELVENLLAKFPYCQFDYLTNSFSFNRLRVLGRKHIMKELRLFHQATTSPENFAKLLQQYFQESIIHLPRSKESEAQEYLENALQASGTNRFSPEEFQNMIAQITTILTNAEKIQPNRLLHRIGYKADRINHKPQSKHYNEYKVVPLPTMAGTTLH